MTHSVCTMYTDVPQPPVTSVSGSSLEGYAARMRVPSHSLRELAFGKFIVKLDDITLLDSIGEGIITDEECFIVTNLPCRGVWNSV